MDEEKNKPIEGEEPNLDDNQTLTPPPTDKPRGRAGVLAKFKAQNPDREDDPNDDELWNFAGEGYDEVKNQHRRMLDGQKGLHDYVAKDPRFGAAIGMSFGEGDDKISLPRALGRVYGEDAFKDDEEFAEGFREFNENLRKSKESLQQAQANFDEKTAPRLEAFFKAKGLNQAQQDEVFKGLSDLAESMYMGDVPEKLIEVVYKGLNYDQDVKEAATTGEIEGKNQKIRAELAGRIPSSAGGAVDMGKGTNTISVKPKTKTKETPSFVDQLKEVD